MFLLFVLLVVLVFGSLCALALVAGSRDEAFQGELSSLSDSFDDMKEEVGAMLIPALTRAALALVSREDIQ